MIRVSCKCGFRGQVLPNYAGKQVKCRQCAGTIIDSLAIVFPREGSES